jgi:hypothetical protein
MLMGYGDRKVNMMEFFGFLVVALAIWDLTSEVRKTNKIRFAKLRFEQEQAGWDSKKIEDFKKQIALEE